MNKEELLEPMYEAVMQCIKEDRAILLTLLEEKVKWKINIHRELSRQYVGSIEDIPNFISSENIHLFVIKNLEDVLSIIEELKK